MLKSILYDWNGANASLFHVINDWRGTILDGVMLSGTYLGSYNLLPVCLILFFVIRRVNASSPFNDPKWSVTAMVLAGAGLIDMAFLFLAKRIFDFPRPPLALPEGLVHVVGQKELHHSLPSGHSSFAMLLAACLWPMLGFWQKGLAVLYVLWIGLSRINVGAHFPSDVLAGWLTVLPIVFMVRYATRHWFKDQVQAFLEKPRVEG
ncbi:MAG: phosphatase PAP2 family protein [Magnetococcales bacterium]|nr:phosphatase PAP2 family protein [Magnetococcales bacterium]